MSSTELVDLETLLERVLPDPMGFAERVGKQLVDRLSTDLPGGERPVVVSTYESIVHEALLDRNVLLAAALGACDCWGQQVDCPICSGEGRAGWVEPDPGLYAEYVEPAVVRMSCAEVPAE